MTSYPVEIAHEADGTYHVTAPHFPELSVVGNSEQDVLVHARHAIEEIIATRIANRQVVPVPIKSFPDNEIVELTGQVSAVLENYWRFNLGQFAPERPLDTGRS